jgi:ectoine hydroxylase-related dioxygenase (phytanoyl-CoA dioxygenase family)
MKKNRHSSEVTDKQLRHWEKHGYLLLQQVLSATEAEKLFHAVDAVLESANGAQTFLQRNSVPDKKIRAFKIAQAITQTEALDSLTDHPRIFPWLLKLIGPYLQVLGTDILVRQPSPGAKALVDWHTDGGPALSGFLPGDGNPILQLKVQFFLTDLTEPDRGNFMLVPGSHRVAFPTEELSPVSPPAGAIQIKAKMGDAILFPWSLWHAVAPNRSRQVRKSIVFRYGPMWSRPYDYEHLPSTVLARMTPRRRRLFGDLGEEPHPSAYFYPDPCEQLQLMLNDGDGPTP